jgi:hypothetical protein
MQPILHLDLILVLNALLEAADHLQKHTQILVLRNPVPPGIQLQPPTYPVHQQLGRVDHLCSRRPEEGHWETRGTELRLQFAVQVEVYCFRNDLRSIRLSRFFYLFYYFDRALDKSAFWVLLYFSFFIEYNLSMNFSKFKIDFMWLDKLSLWSKRDEIFYFQFYSSSWFNFH